MRFLVLAFSGLTAGAALGGCAFDRNGIDTGAGGDGGLEDVDAAADDRDATVDAAGSADVPAIDPVDAGAPDAPAVLTPDAAVPTPDAAVPTPDAGGSDPGPCPIGYVAGTVETSSCYRLVAQPRTWATAENDCANDAVGSTHLAVISSLAEYQAFQNALGGEVWMGAADLKSEGAFLNVTGAPMFDNPTMWAPDQPDDDGDGPGGLSEDCLALRDNGLNDDDCSDTHPYLCERDGIPPDPDAF